MKNKKKKNITEECEDALKKTSPLAGVQEVVDKYGSAAAEFIEGYTGKVAEDGEVISKGLEQIAESKVDENFEYQNIKQQSGFSAERHFVDKNNAENIIKGDKIRYSRSNDAGRGNDQKIDILAVDSEGNPLMCGDEPLWGAQMKFSGKYGSADEIKCSAESVADRMTGDKWSKYRGNKVLVPSEQYKHIVSYSSEQADRLYAQAKKFRVEGNIDKALLLEEKAAKYRQVANDVCDSGISSEEAMFLRKHPKLATAKSVIKTAHRAGIEQAKAGAVIAGSISLAKNITSVAKGDKSFDEAIKDTAIDTVSGAAAAYVTASSGAMVKGFMQKSSSKAVTALSKSNLPALIGTAVLVTGKSLYKYVNGEINTVELVSKIGVEGTGMIAASWGAAAGTAILPGVGTIAGGMIGYMASSIIYGSAMDILNDEKISEERKKKLIPLIEASIEAMEIQKNEIKEFLSQYKHENDSLINDGFELVNISGKSYNMEKFSMGLSKIAEGVGISLKFKSFTDFNEFMKDPYSKLEF